MKAAEYNALIPLTEMVKYLGFVHNPKKGSERAVWISYDKLVNGKRDHTIVVNRVRNTFFCQQTGEHGSLFDFVKARVHEFSAFKPYQGEAVDKQWMETIHVLDDYLGPSASSGVSITLPVSEPPRAFSLNDYTITYPSPSRASQQQFLVIKRHLSPSTVSRFLSVRAIAHVKDRNREFAYANYGFPMRIPGSPDIVNFELRNYNAVKGQSFKGFCPGGNKSEALWIAEFPAYSASSLSSPTPPLSASSIQDVYVFESAIDAMSFCELVAPTDGFAVVSCGGYMTFGSISKLPSVYPSARFHACFDNDSAGRMYDVMLAYALQGERIRLSEMSIAGSSGQLVPHIQITMPDGSFQSISSAEFNPSSFLAAQDLNGIFIRHCAAQFKDWNEQLTFIKTRQKENNTTAAVSPTL